LDNDFKRGGLTKTISRGGPEKNPATTSHKQTKKKGATQSMKGKQARGHIGGEISQKQFKRNGVQAWKPHRAQGAEFQGVAITLGKLMDMIGIGHKSADKTTG